jgi:hypothetical protein
MKRMKKNVNQTLSHMNRTLLPIIGPYALKILKTLFNNK